MAPSSSHKLVISKGGLLGWLTRGGIKESAEFTRIFRGEVGAGAGRRAALVTIPFVSRERYCSGAVPRVLHSTSHSLPRANPPSEPDLESACNR